MGNNKVPVQMGNSIRLRMRAIGLKLDGLNWWITDAIPGYVGFEFECKQFEQLLNLAEKNHKFSRNTVSLPGDDRWRKAGIEFLGYSEKGVYNYLHLDIATNKDQLCRVYVAPHGWGRFRDALTQPDYLTNDVYIQVAKRVAALGIKLDNFIDTAKVGGTPLDGVTFSPANYEGLAEAVQAAKRNGNVIEGKTVGKKDVIDLSFLATTGTGFREISWTDGEQAHLDFSALHFALSPLTCNIHIDEFGVVIGTEDGRISLSPNALHHIGNELILKTIIKEFLHQKINLPKSWIDRIFIEGPNAANRFNKYGAGVEFHPWESVKITGGISCSILGGDSCRVEFGFTKRFGKKI